MVLAAHDAKDREVLYSRRRRPCYRRDVLTFRQQVSFLRDKRRSDDGWVSRYFPVQDTPWQFAEKAFSRTNGKHLVRQTSDGKYYEVAVHLSVLQKSECGEILDCYRNDTEVATNTGACADAKATLGEGGYDEFCQRAVKGIWAHGKSLDQYYRHHPFYPVTAIVIEMASFLQDLTDYEHTQKTFMRDLVLLGCLLETESSQYSQVDMKMVAVWQSRFQHFLQHPFKTYADQQNGLLQVALLRRVLSASGGQTTKATERFIPKGTPSQNLGLLGAAIGVQGPYSWTECDTGRISTALVGHRLFDGQDTSRTAIETRLRELRRHVPIAYPDIVSYTEIGTAYD